MSRALDVSLGSSQGRSHPCRAGLARFFLPALAGPRFTLYCALFIGSMMLTTAAGVGMAADTAASTGVHAVDAYTPGLGDFMTAYVQPHHIKLWFAANAGNWRLAAYEADELRETFDDIATYQSTWKNVPVAQLIKTLIDPALQGVKTAIEDRKLTAFKGAYTALTEGCNACHKAAQHDFLRIEVPAVNPFSDQGFAVH